MNSDVVLTIFAREMARIFGWTRGKFISKYKDYNENNFGYNSI